MPLYEHEDLRLPDIRYLLYDLPKQNVLVSEIRVPIKIKRATLLFKMTFLKTKVTLVNNVLINKNGMC